MKELSEKIEGMEKRIQELEKICKNLCTERMEKSELSLQNEVVKILSEKIERMEKRIQELEKICKNP